jgi:hypothetical protein
MPPGGAFGREVRGKILYAGSRPIAEIIKSKQPSPETSV